MNSFITILQNLFLWVGKVAAAFATRPTFWAGGEVTQSGASGARSASFGSSASLAYHSPGQRVALRLGPVRILAGLLLVLAFTFLATVGLQQGSAGAATSCTGRQVLPSQNLSSVANSYPRGTTFCLADGTYNVSTPIKVEDGDKFIGVYSDSTRPQVQTDSAEHIFWTKDANNATIKDLAVTGATGGDYCEPNCGRGIGGGGSNLLVENVRAYQNANQGVGGVGPGLLIKDSLLDKNGSESFTDRTGPRSSAGIKTTSSFTVINSIVKDNYWNGVWCDVECGTLKVIGSTITGNGKMGVGYEISSGPDSEISGNVIQGNGWKNTFSREAEIVVGSSTNLDIYDNDFGPDSNDAVQAYSDDRGSLLADITIRQNTLNGDSLDQACSKAGVTCRRNS